MEIKEIKDLNIENLKELKLDEKVIMDDKLTDKLEQIEGLKEVGDDTYTPPCIHPAIENYITLDQFCVRFEEPCFIEEGNVISVTKPSFNIRKGKYAPKKVYLTFRVINAVHYFGKPSRYSNLFSDNDIFGKIVEFNSKKFAFMDVLEYDSEGKERFRTRYTAPRITKVDFPAFDKNQEGVVKYYTAEIQYNEMTNETCKY